MKYIKGYENIYSITSDGKVWSYPRNGFKKNSSGFFMKNQIIKGYEKVNLRNRNRKMFFIHRLVYETYIGTIPKGMYINHKDGNKRNNNLNNLELVTPKQNTAHAIRLGLIQNKGESASLAKLNWKSVKDIRKDYTKKKCRQVDLANQYGVCQRTISCIVRNETWVV